MSQHTHGPWYWADNVPDAPKNYFAIVDADGFTIAEPSPMGHANARLIAAAPDLLAAVQALDDAFSHYCDGDPSPEEWAALQAARAAVAKATGSAP